MKFLRVATALIIILVIILAGSGNLAYAGPSDPVFVNLATDDNHKANMAIG